MKKNNEKEEQNNDFEPQTSGAESSTIEKNSEIEKLKALLSEEKAKTKDSTHTSVRVAAKCINDFKYIIWTV